MNRSILSPVKHSTKSSPAMVGEVYTNYIRPNISGLKKVSRSTDAIDFLKGDWTDIDHLESFKTLFLNRNNLIIGWALISKGGVNGTVADGKIIFQKALACNASGIILAHNHPSGNTMPSESDIRLTKSLKEVAKQLDIQVLDHVILTSDNSFYSFADEGVM